MTRANTLERLGEELFALVVIGAGIIGARVAYEAASAGATVAMIDAHDFGSATSSASSKLVHGGLRYLQMHDFDLVREAHHERRALLDRLAPTWFGLRPSGSRSTAGGWRCRPWMGRPF